MLGAGLRVAPEVQVDRVAHRPRVLGQCAENTLVAEETEEITVDAAIVSVLKTTKDHDSYHVLTEAQAHPGRTHLPLLVRGPGR
jgi:hypothetical protein